MCSSTQPAWRLLAFDPRRRVWTARDTYTTLAEAQDNAEALQWKGTKRVRIVPTTRIVLTPAAPVTNASRDYRLAQAAKMSDRADAAKPYKTNGSDQLALPKAS